MVQAVSLKNGRFLGFLTAQFLGAFNDNAFKLVISMASLDLITDPARQQSYLAITSALAILPYLLFSGYAGYFADRYAKSNVLRISKAAEIVAMGAALILFMTDPNIKHLMVTLFLLALHSAFFSPSKYGILPEIMTPENLPKANGYLNMLTFIAIIIGSVSGAALWGHFKHTPEIIGFTLTGIAILGTLLCLFVPESAPGNPQKKFVLNPFAEIIGGVRHARKNPLLLACMAGSATFWMLGGLIYLSLILLGKTQLGLSETAAGSLFAFLASGIALGSVIAGYLIGKKASPIISFVGGCLLSLGCFATGFFAVNYTITAVLVSVVGLGGGLFIVPVATLLQKNSPDAVRGQLLATSSFFDMLGVFLASWLFWLLGTQFALTPSATIMVAGGISLVGIFTAIVARRRVRTFSPHTTTTLGARFIHQAKCQLWWTQLTDTTGQSLDGLRALVGARLLAQWLAPTVSENPHVALLLPASAAGALANFAVALLGKTSVNINFSLSPALIEEALTKAEITTIVTARKVVAKLKIEPDNRMVFIDDAAANFSRSARIKTALQAALLPRRILCRYWLYGKQDGAATATILFSSGSTAAPKAVMLSHTNLLSNIDSVDSLLVQAEAHDHTRYVLAGTLPFFHSFGLTVCLWLPAVTGRRIAYHANPLEAKSVTRMIAAEHCHLLVTTPTFASHYITAAKAGALDSLRFVILGGEKLTEAIEEQLTHTLPHAHILQGYGCTECGPVVAINVPDELLLHGTGQHPGSVGRPIPGVRIKVVDQATRKEMPTGTDGLILVNSASCMQGYYKDSELTDAVFEKNDWYITGDIGHVDADGFLTLTDRLSRFSKISGEMVPHGKIEEALAAVMDGGSDSVVVAIPHGSKGEALAVLTTSTQSAATIHAALKKQGLPNLWIPAADAIFTVPSIPYLATGKRDLQAIRALVQARAGKPTGHH